MRIKHRRGLISVGKLIFIGIAAAGAERCAEHRRLGRAENYSDPVVSFFDLRLRIDAGCERQYRMVLVRAAAAWLDGRPQLGLDTFVRPTGRNPRVASYMALLEACLFVLREPDWHPGAEEAVYRPVPMALFRVDEAMARIRRLVASQASKIAFPACLPAMAAEDPQCELKARSAVASSFLAILELERAGEVVATQEDHQSSILLRARGPEDQTPAC